MRKGKTARKTTSVKETARAVNVENVHLLTEDVHSREAAAHPLGISSLPTIDHSTAMGHRVGRVEVALIDQEDLIGNVMVDPKWFQTTIEGTVTEEVHHHQNTIEETRESMAHLTIPEEESKDKATTAEMISVEEMIADQTRVVKVSNSQGSTRHQHQDHVESREQNREENREGSQEPKGKAKVRIEVLEPTEVL